LFVDLSHDRVVQTILEALRTRLAEPLPGHDAQSRMAPRLLGEPAPRLATEDLRPAAAILLIYPHEGAWYVPLTVRGSHLRHHTGQVSLPGGRIDPGETIEGAALREAHEEVGVVPSEVELLGHLTPLTIDVSGHLLHPVVGRTDVRPRFQVEPGEVERLIEVPLALLRQPEIVKWEQRRRSRPPLTMMDVPYFEIAGAHVWGATAMILAEFLALLDDLN